MVLDLRERLEMRAVQCADERKGRRMDCPKVVMSGVGALGSRKTSEGRVLGMLVGSVQRNFRTT